MVSNTRSSRPNGIDPAGRTKASNNSWGGAHRHGQNELEHRHAQRGGVDEAAAGEHEVREGALARVADGMLLMHVLVIAAAQRRRQSGLAPRVRALHTCGKRRDAIRNRSTTHCKTAVR